MFRLLRCLFVLFLLLSFHDNGSSVRIIFAEPLIGFDINSEPPPLIDYTFDERTETAEEIISNLEQPVLPPKQILNFDINDIKMCLTDCIQDAYDNVARRSLTESTFCPDDITNCINGQCTLIDRINGIYTCTCNTGWTGDACDIVDLVTIVNDICNDLQPCQNGGSCILLDTTTGTNVQEYICNCDATGYTGLNCEFEILNCNNDMNVNPCLNGGNCIDIDDDNGYICDCTGTSYTGTFCEINIHDSTCPTVPCQNDGECVVIDNFDDGIEIHECDCTNTEYIGNFCEEYIGPCKFEPCLNGGQCIIDDNTDIGYICNCDNTLHDGFNCENYIGRCSTQPCQNDGECVPDNTSATGYICICTDSFVGSQCETPINNNDACDTQPCQNEGVCVVDNTSSTGYICRCPDTYVGPQCETPINNDACDTQPCQNNGVCIPDTTSSTGYICDCTDNYVGLQCETSINACDAQPCQNNGVCSPDTSNSSTTGYICDCTNTGYEGQQCEINIDDCINNPCLNNGRCIDATNGYSCDCSNTGFDGMNCENKIIDDCRINECMNNGECTNNNNNGNDDIYYCDCTNTGFTGPLCEDPIDYCRDFPCMNDGVCTSINGSYICDCAGTGFTGPNCDVDIGELRMCFNNCADNRMSEDAFKSDELDLCREFGLEECLVFYEYKVLVEIIAVTSDSLPTVLESIRSEEINCFNNVCSAYIPIQELENLSLCSVAMSSDPTPSCPFDALEIRSIQLVEPSTKSGMFTSDGDAAILSDNLRDELGVDGTGLMVGVISDSYDCLGGASADIANGDLPEAENIKILLDWDSPRCIDEGRAMMLIIHAIAPGAKLAFHTGFLGLSSFASGINALADAGCDVIVDDVLYRAEPFFQDGIISQAVDEVVRRGIPFFSSVGNYGRSAWDAEAGFVDSGIELFEGEGFLHQFGTDEIGNPIISNRLVLPNVDQNILFTLQWDEPFASSGGPGCQSDLDIYVYYGSALCGKGYTSNTSTGDAEESFSVNPSRCTGSSAASVELDVFITLFSGPAPTYMKVVPLVANSLFEFATNSATSFGHDHAELNCAVGAANYLDTPEFGVSPPEIQWFSSAGGTPIFFDANGNRHNKPVIREQPKIIGPDGITTSFFGQLDNNNQYRFYGTSAAAPHVAAVAALLLQIKPDLTPTELYNVLARTADDMDDPLTQEFDDGFDYRTGFGLVNALKAGKYLASIDGSVPATGAPTTVQPAPMPASTTQPTTMPPTDLSDVCSRDCTLLFLEGTTMHLDFLGFFCVPFCIPYFPNVFDLIFWDCGGC